MNLQSCKIRTYRISGFIRCVRSEAKRAGYCLPVNDPMTDGLFLRKSGTSGHTKKCSDNFAANKYPEITLHDLQQMPDAKPEIETKVIDGVVCRRLLNGDVIEKQDYFIYDENAPTEMCKDAPGKKIGGIYGYGDNKYFRPINIAKPETEVNIKEDLLSWDDNVGDLTLGETESIEEPDYATKLYHEACISLISGHSVKVTVRIARELMRELGLYDEKV